MERLCSSFGVDFHYSGSHAPRENNQSMVSCDWAAQHIHECIVGSLCRFCPARKLGLCANKLMHWWELTGQIWIYDYAVPVSKKGRPNCGGPSEEGKRPAGDDGRSYNKASKPLRCCDTRHCGRHGTRSASRLMTPATGNKEATKLLVASSS